MDDLQLLVDLHKDGSRQGPGGVRETRLAIELSGLAQKEELRIADIGCGTGASTLVLAEALDAQIIAVDFLPEFLQRLQQSAAAKGMAERITTLSTSMDALPFEPQSLDAIWSEGAIYNMGFEAGIAAWRKYLKPGGILAVSELTWTTGQRPAELQQHWEREYAEVATGSAKMATLERHGYSPTGYFTLPEHCWLDNYYLPLRQRFDGFLEKHHNASEARAVVAAEEQEISLYERHRAFVSYGFYIARKVRD